MLSLLCMFAFGSVSAEAQTAATKDTTAYSLVVVSKTVTTHIMLSHHPVITVSDDTLKVVSDSVDVEVALADVDNYHLADVTYQIGVPTGIQQVNTTMKGGAVCGLKQGDVVSVYGIDGKQVLSVAAGTDGVANLNFSGLSKNVYIIHTPTATYKVVNK